MPLVDLTRPLSAASTVLPGDPPFRSRVVASLAADGYLLRSLALSTHTGTHVDAPAHVVPGGATLDELDLALFTGPAVVVDARGLGPRGVVQPHHLPELRPGDVVLVRTGWDARAGGPAELDHPHLAPATARALRRAGVRTVGIDTASVDPTPAPAGLPAHVELLGPPGDPGVVVENLTGLGALPARGAVVDVLPLRLTGGDGSPVRAVARW